MTFLEAAIEVLRHENGPLEISQITQRAVAQKLLSHIGRDPEAAMRTCLDTASRDSSAGGIVEKDGNRGFRIRPGAKLPETKLHEAKPESKLEVRSGASSRSASSSDDEDEDSDKKPNDIKDKSRGSKVNSSGDRDASLRQSGENDLSEEDKSSSDADSSTSSRRTAARSRGTSRRRTSAARKKPEPERPASTANEQEGSEASLDRQRSLEFTAPTGAGLDGVTDVALVMANAMSRLAGTRPELRHELEAMQQRERAEDEEPASAKSSEAPRGSSREGLRSCKEGDLDERSGRRRRRRRKKGARGHESDGTTSNRKDASTPSVTDLLDRVAVVLGEAGAKAVHIRQIAESLASQGVLGAEVSELERRLTAAIVVDRQQRGAASRFCIRGDSRYQLRDTRLPQSLAYAEEELRRSVRAVELETQAQLVRWIEQLGIRGFEALVRCYCEYKGLQILSMPASGRGMVRMIVEDSNSRYLNEGLTLMLILPRKTQFDLRALGSELERYTCSSAMVFSGTPLVPPPGEDDIRLVSAEQLARQLIEFKIVVDEVQLHVPVVNPSIIESIGGLDS